MAITTNYTKEQKADLRALALKEVQTRTRLIEDYGCEVVDHSYHWSPETREVDSITIKIQQDGRSEFLKFDL